jgi:predicted transcriptional regulator
MEVEITLAEVAKILDADVVCGHEFLGRKMSFVFASDLMSDVLTVNSENLLLITGLCNIQTIRASEMSDISNIVFVRSKKASDEMIEIAEENDITLLECGYSMFKASGLLFEAGLKPLY